MHVVVVVPMYPPNARVGAFLATHELLTDLVTRGHRVDVLTRAAAEAVYELDGVTVGPGVAKDQVDVAVAVCDLVISHAGDDGVAARAAQKWAKPSVRMVHGYHEDLDVRLAGATLVVFNSHASQKEAAWQGDQVVVRPPLRANLGALPGGRVTLINLSETKGGDLFWRLARSMPHIEFLGVRGGWGNQIPGLKPNVAVVAPTQDMRAIYANTRILLMPSERESWGMVGLEAMTCGIPVIAHPTEGLKESLGDAAIFVDRNNGQGWVDEIERLQHPAEWQVASTRALERAQTIPDDRHVFTEAIESLMVTA